MIEAGPVIIIEAPTETGSPEDFKSKAPGKAWSTITALHADTVDDMVEYEYLSSRYGQLVRGVDRMKGALAKLHRLDKRVSESGSRLIPLMLQTIRHLRIARSPTHCGGEGGANTNGGFDHDDHLHSPRPAHSPTPDLFKSTHTSETMASMSDMLQLCEDALSHEERKREPMIKRQPTQVVREELSRMMTDFERSLELEELELMDVREDLESLIGGPVDKDNLLSAQEEALRADEARLFGMAWRPSTPSTLTAHSATCDVHESNWEYKDIVPAVALHSRQRSLTYPFALGLVKRCETVSNPTRHRTSRMISFEEPVCSHPEHQHKGTCRSTGTSPLSIR